MAAKFWAGSLWASPTILSVLASPGENWTMPSPLRVEAVAAPAFQPAPPVLVRLEPEVDTPTASCQNVPNDAFLMVEPVVKSEVPRRSGRVGAVLLAH